MTKLIWLASSILSFLFLILFIPIIFSFNIIAGSVLGYIFFRLFVLCIESYINENNAIEWADSASDSPLLNNNPQNISNLPAHPLHDRY